MLVIYMNIKLFSLATSTLCSPCTQTFPLSVHVVIYGLCEVGIREKIVIPCEKKEKKRY
jgi:antibiotic biosynthesis monooxygenase (ABM) superfamily enzyme